VAARSAEILVCTFAAMRVSKSASRSQFICSLLNNNTTGEVAKLLMRDEREEKAGVLLPVRISYKNAFSSSHAHFCERRKEKNTRREFCFSLRHSCRLSYTVFFLVRGPLRRSIDAREPRGKILFQG